MQATASEASIHQQRTPTGQSTRPCIGIYKGINTPTQLIGCVAEHVNTTHAHTQLRTFPRFLERVVRVLVNMQKS